MRRFQQLLLTALFVLFPLTARAGANSTLRRPFGRIFPRATVVTPIVVSNTNDSGAGSLRNAITQANTHAGTDTIQFSIGRGGFQTISPATPLPAVTDSATIIDGTSQPGYSGTPLIFLSGGTASVNTDVGLEIQAAGCQVQGFSFSGWGTGILLDGTGASSNVVASCFFGASSDGNQIAAPGNDVGIKLSNGAKTNFVGMTSPTTPNLFCGNQYGVEITDATTSSNSIVGNYIGTTLSGLEPLANRFGVGIFSGAHDNVIGGASAGLGNLISGNTDSNIYAEGAVSNVISGNLIGTTSTGLLSIDTSASTSGGIWLTNGSNSNVIGGATAASRNTIAGNSGPGIVLQGTSLGSGPISNLNEVIGNYIGLNSAGASLGNSDGIHVEGATNTTIGLGTAGTANVISSNGLSDGGRGIWITGATSTGTIIQGNLIGTDRTGVTGSGNGYEGIYINDAVDTTVGGTTPRQRNLISGNGLFGTGASGVLVDGPNASGNVIQGNYIGTNLSGTSALANNAQGIFLNSAGTHVTNNLISGNITNGISTSGSNNTILGNLIGTDATGTVALANGAHGIGVYAATNTIGDGTTAGRNIISGNAINGIALSGTACTGTIVQGNYIGTDITGTKAIGNVSPGIAIGQGANGNTIGGQVAADGNLISGNFSGIAIFGAGADNNTVASNYIGTNATGTAAIPNLNAGVGISNGAQNNTIGFSATPVGAAPGNIISGNTTQGITVTGSGTKGVSIEGNIIGLNAAGTAALPNGSDGVAFSDYALGNAVGGYTTSQTNIIGYNGRDGINVSTDAIRNYVQANTFVANHGMPVNLQPTGEGDSLQTGNDSLDADTGPNELQNFPLVTINALSSTMVSATLILHSMPGSYFGLDLYRATAASPLTFNYVTTANAVTTDANGNATVTLASTPGNAGDIFRAIAVDSEGNSSEFSPGTTVSGVPTGTLVVNLYSPVQEGSGITYHGYAQRTGSVAAAVTVTLSASPSNRLNLPVSVTMPVGDPSIDFNFTVINDTVYQGAPQDVVITGSANGLPTATDTVQVLDDDTPGGELFGWGSNQYGQLGTDDTTDRSSPTQADLSNVRFVAANGSHTLAIRADGTVWAWGYNGGGQLGNGNTTDQEYPVQVTGLTNPLQVAAGWYHSLALQNDGTVWAWGYNNAGQLGDGTVITRLHPVRVSGLTGVKAIAAGVYFSLALKSDGTVWGWGNNLYGQIGNLPAGSNPVDVLTPRQITGLSNIVAISAGGGHSLFLTSAGDVYALGWNYYGQLGNGSSTDAGTPVKVTGASGISSIAAGYANSVACNASGAVLGWGDNSYSQIGTGSSAKVPTSVASLIRTKEVTAGADFTLSLSDTAIPHALGANDLGQLGRGTFGGSSPSADAVNLLSMVTQMAAGYGHGMAIGVVASTNIVKKQSQAPAISAKNALNKHGSVHSF